jgi:hypothetical protein
VTYIPETVKNVTAGILFRGTPVHVTGSVGQQAEVILADAATNYPAHYILNEDINAGASGEAIAIGLIENVDLTPFGALHQVSLKAMRFTLGQLVDSLMFDLLEPMQYSI